MVKTKFRNKSVKEQIRSLLAEKPEYYKYLQRCVEFQRENEGKWQYEWEGFMWDQVRAEPARLNKMVTRGILKKTSSGRRKEYRLVSLAETEKALFEFEQAKALLEQSEKAPSPTFQGSTDIPSDLFSMIVGYDDVKRLFRMSLKGETPTHILMIGPPASSKTVFLLEIARLKGAFYLLGGSTSKVGLIDQLFTLSPGCVLLDELDKMEKTDYVALLSLMETGIVLETKHRKCRKMMLPAKVYAACNSEQYLPSEILSRFQFKLHFKQYTKEEFIGVSEKVLIQRENKPENMAVYIANKVAELSRDVRECIGIARLAKSKEDVDFLIKVKRQHEKMV